MKERKQAIVFTIRLIEDKMCDIKYLKDDMGFIEREKKLDRLREQRRCALAVLLLLTEAELEEEFGS